MSTKTLTDELRSVLLYHSLEAPQPSATVDRILADTVGPVLVPGAGSPAGEPVPGRLARSHQLVAAAVVALLLVTVAGINSFRNRNAASTATQLSQGSPVRGAAEDTATSPGAAGGGLAAPQGSGSSGGKLAPPSPPRYAGKLDCSTIPGGRLVTGQWDDFTLSNGEVGYLYEFLCVGSNGQRSASELQVFQQAGGKLQYKETLLRAASDQHLDFMTGGADTVRIQASVSKAPLTGRPGEVVSTTWDLSAADHGDGYTFTVAEPCLRKDLDVAVTVIAGAAAPAWRLSLRNHTDAACALEGYPQVRAQRGGATLTTAVHTLSGTAGGLTSSPVPPIIVLSPGATAAAIIEQSAVSAAGSCQRSDRLAVTLPNGASLDPVPAELSGCGLAVHPLIGNARGSD